MLPVRDLPPPCTLQDMPANAHASLVVPKPLLAASSSAASLAAATAPLAAATGTGDGDGVGAGVGVGVGEGGRGAGGVPLVRLSRGWPLTERAQDDALRTTRSGQLSRGWHVTESSAYRALPAHFGEGGEGGEGEGGEGGGGEGGGGRVAITTRARGRQPSSRNLVLEIFMPRARWAELPEELKQGQLIRCVVALISQGINAQQSMANAVGHAELQEIINCRALELLRRYHEAYISFASSTASNTTMALGSGEGGGRGIGISVSISSTANRDGFANRDGISSTAKFDLELERRRLRLRELTKLMHAVEATILRSVELVNKDTDVIALTERLVRELGGGRITSCKSGKDRTSMAVTAEQARLLHESHAVSEAEANELLDAMRSHGVRWLNMRKNMGALGQYAFNWLQQRLLPEGYRAPKGTYTQIFRSMET